MKKKHGALLRLLRGRVSVYRPSPKELPNGWRLQIQKMQQKRRVSADGGLEQPMERDYHISQV